MDTFKAVKIGIVTVIVTSAGIYVIKKVIDKTKYKKSKKFWDQVGQDVVVLHLPLRPKSAGIRMNIFIGLLHSLDTVMAVQLTLIFCKDSREGSSQCHVGSNFILLKMQIGAFQAKFH